MITPLGEDRRAGRLPLAQALSALAGLFMLAAAVWLWADRPVGPAAVESDLRPAYFSVGLDHPAVKHLDRQGARAFWAGPGIVMPNGFAPGVNKIWPDLGTEIPDPTLAPLKIIPSGGLLPYYRSTTFAGEIEAFVRRGGSLICLGQPLGGAYAALPRAPKAVGWAEAACQPREAVGEAQAATDHPALAGLEHAEFAAHFAGFFTGDPRGTERTEVLVRDTVTGRPVVIAYRHGKGLVLATTLTSDAAATQERLGRDEQALLQGLVAWARSGGAAIPQFIPGDMVEMAITLAEGTVEAAKGYAEVIKPDGGRDSRGLELPPAGETEVRQYFTVQEPRGIWRIVSYRQDADGRAAGPLSSTWFAVGHAPEAREAAALHYTITVPGAYLVTGSVLPIQIMLWNDGPTESEITFRGPAGKNTVKLQPGQARVCRDEIALDSEGYHILAYEFFGPAGERLGGMKRRVEAGPPDRIFMSWPESRKNVARGQLVPLDLTILSLTPGSFKADCWLRLTHNGRTVWQEPRRPVLNGAYSHVEKIKVPLPAGTAGRFVLEAALMVEGKELARAWKEIVAE